MTAPEQMIVIPDSHQKGPLKTGGKSSLLKAWGSCSVCPVRDYCSRYELMSKEQKDRGCTDIRNVFLENMKRWKKPLTVMIRNAAEVATRIQMQAMIDGKEKNVASPKWIKLKELELKIAREINKFDPDASQQRITVKHEFGPDSDEIIPLNPDAYDSDVLSDEPAKAHGNYRPKGRKEDQNEDS